MPISPSPAKIRAVVKRLTGISVQGAIKRSKFEGMTVFTCTDQGILYHCTHTDGSWMVFNSLPNGDRLRTWTDKVVVETRITGELARHVLEPTFGKTKLTFEHELVEHALEPGGEVIRRTFGSPLGPVVVHSRKIGADTEAIVQVSSKQWIGKLVRDGATGAIVLNPTILSALPF
jgi:hypothetical protein